ncbi:MAG: hypothetical protein WBA74_26105 [Cyclobacteriaceae bacterium]
MSDVKERGNQYLLFVAVILALLSIAIFLKPKTPSGPVITGLEAESDAAITRVNTSKDSIVSDFEKLPPEIPADSNTSGTEISFTDTQDIESWYDDLINKYTAKAENLSDYHDVVIRYYRKPRDGDKVDHLKELGFYIHERPTKTELKDLYTNTIYYGDSVRREDILVVAYQLIRSGIKLQAIDHSRFGDNWKSHSIELGTDTTMLNRPELSLDSIRQIVKNNPHLKVRM